VTIVENERRVTIVLRVENAALLGSLEIQARSIALGTTCDVTILTY
jgi:hypothetical protein